MLRLDSHRDLTQLRSVKLRSDERDTLRVRQRFEQALAAADWTPAGLPPQALLLVRRMVVRQPATRAIDNLAIGLQVTQVLREHSRVARRPWLDHTANTAPAVWFNDEHELAACLVRDWLHGDVSNRWWWRAVLGTVAPADWLREHVLRHGERIAPVLAQLAGQGHAVAWLKRMDDGDIACAIAMLARAYDAPLAVADPPGSVDDDREDDRGAHTQHARKQDENVMPSNSMRQRLARAVPELLDNGLRPAAIRLLAYALVALREPAWLRTQTLSMAVAQWIEYKGTGETSLDAPTASLASDSQSIRVSTQQPKRVLTQSPRPDSALQASTELETVSHPKHDGRQTSAERTASAQHAVIEAQRGEAQATRQHRDASDSRISDGDAPATGSRTGNEPPSVEIPTAQTRDALEPLFETQSHAASDENEATAREIISPSQTSQDIETAFGGLFYLLNAALALGLYGDFSTPRTPGIALSPWDWLALIGQRWFGREFLQDPVSPLLASLAGRRPRDEPGVDFDAPDRWAISDAWLTPWLVRAESSIAAVHYRAIRGRGNGHRLQLWHADGFLLFDVPRDPRRTPLAQAQRLCVSRRLLRGAHLQRLARAPVRLPARNPRQRWLSWLLPYLQARLALALGIGASADDVAAMLCRQHARVRCDMTTLQIRMSLAALPLPIRIAGLDRDPGWMPAAGRALQFQFS